MKQRVITGACIAAVMAGVLALSHLPYVMAAFVAFLSVMAVYELYKVGDMCKQIAPFALSLAWAAVFPFLPVPWFPSLLGIVLGLSMIAGSLAMRFFSKWNFKRPLPVFLVSLAFPILYSSLTHLRAQEQGLWYVILVIVSCFGTDTGAYFIGSAFGKHKLAPELSPKKTVEGFFGGVAINVVAYLLVGLILRFMLPISVSLPLLAGLGVACGVLDQLGDLTLSAIKRNFGVKDFGRLMPGHGGVLDRFDSLLFVGGFVCVFISQFPILYT